MGVENTLFQIKGIKLVDSQLWKWVLICLLKCQSPITTLLTQKIKVHQGIKIIIPEFGVRNYGTRNPKHFLFSFSYCNHHLQTFSSSLWLICSFVWSLDICILSNKSFILECKESFQLSSLSKQEFSWSNSWSSASYSARENK